MPNSCSDAGKKYSLTVFVEQYLDELKALWVATKILTMKIEWKSKMESKAE